MCLQLGATKQQLQEAEKRDIFSRNSEGDVREFFWISLNTVSARN